MAIDLEVDVRTTQTQAWLRHVFEDQLPFATSQAINQTALRFQKRQQEHMGRIFDVGNERFVMRSVKIKPFSSKRRPWAKVQIDPPGGRKDVLGKFEMQTRKKPRSGSRLAVPIEARMTKTRGVSKTERLPAFDFQPHGSSGRVFKGKKRTFMILQPGGKGLVIKRVGRRKVGKSDRYGRNVRVGNRRSYTKLLFVFRPEVPIDPELNFVENANRVVRESFDEAFSAAFAKAVRTARAPSGSLSGGLAERLRAKQKVRLFGTLPGFTP